MDRKHAIFFLSHHECWEGSGESRQCCAVYSNPAQGNVAAGEAMALKQVIEYGRSLNSHRTVDYSLNGSWLMHMDKPYVRIPLDMLQCSLFKPLDLARVEFINFQ